MIVGREDYKIERIVSCMESNPSFTTVVLAEWQMLGRKLETPKLAEMQQNILVQLNKPSAIFSAVTAFFHEWSNRLAENATFEALLDIFEECGWTEIAEQLRKDFTKIHETTKWTDLDKRMKQKVLDSSVAMFGRKSTFSEILDRLELSDQEFILNEILSGSNITELLCDTMLLTCENVPKIPDHYVSRKLRSNRRMDLKIFKNHTADVYIIDGISKKQLSDLADREPSSTSSRQIRDFNRDIRFILLEFKEDFDEICKLYNNVPIHLLKYINGNVYWSKTVGKINHIQDHLHKEQGEIEEVGEEQYHAEVQKWNSKCICVADTPGMGKSTLFYSLCEKLRNASSDGVVLFVTFSDVIEHFEEDSLEFSRSMLIEWMSSCISSNKFGDHILRRVLDKQMIELFIDGFDEIPTSKIMMATKLLKYFISDFANVRLHVSTRVHRKHELEQALGTLSYSVIPISGEDKVTLLENVWQHKFGIEVNENLKQFSRELVSMVGAQMGSAENDVVGVPLQCQMLAEICEEDARKHGNAESFKYGAVVDINSVYGLFKKLFEKRFAVIDEADHEVVQRQHAVAAIILLFDDISEDLMECFQLQNAPIYNAEAINRIGLMECKTNVRRGSVTTKFCHRTYAEFSLAEFLVENMGKLGNDYGDRRNFSHLFFDTILETSERDAGILINSADCGVISLWEDIKDHPEAAVIRKNCKSFVLALGMTYGDMNDIQGRWVTNTDSFDPENPVSVRFYDYIYLVLNQWTEWLTLQRSLVDFVTALEELNCNQITEIIKRRYYKKTFSSNNLCFFINSGLNEAIAYETSFHLNYTKSGESNPANLRSILQTCIYEDFSSLFKLVSKCCQDLKDEIFTTTKHIGWSSLITESCRNSEISLIKACCDFVEDFEGKPTSELKYENIDGTIEYTPLHVACRRGDYSIFDFMLKKFENNICEMKCLLHFSVAHSKSDPIETLKQRKDICSTLIDISPELLNHISLQNHETPILVLSLHLDLLTYLISAGTDVTAVDYDDRNVVHCATQSLSSNEFHEFVKFMLENGHGNVFRMKDKSSRYPMHEALENMTVNPETIKLLLFKLNLSFNNPDWEKDTELFSAITGLQSVDVIRLLINTGANATKLRNDDQTVIHAAAAQGHVDALEYFLSTGKFDVNAPDVHKRTPLHLALICGESNVDDVVRILLENNAEVNRVDDEGHTAEYYAEHGDNSLFLEPSTKDLLMVHGLTSEETDPSSTVGIFPPALRAIASTCFSYFQKPAGKRLI